MTAKRILIILGVLALVCCVGVGIAVYVGGRAVAGAVNAIITPMNDATDGFMKNLQADDYQKAYDQLSPDAQTAVGGSADAFKTALTTQGLNDPTSWKFGSSNVNTDSLSTPTAGGGAIPAVFTGTATFKDGSTKNITITLSITGDFSKGFVAKVQSFAGTPS